MDEDDLPPRVRALLTAIDEMSRGKRPPVWVTAVALTSRLGLDDPAALASPISYALRKGWIAASRRIAPASLSITADGTRQIRPGARNRRPKRRILPI
jgi:hypothetical protein